MRWNDDNRLLIYAVRENAEHMHSVGLPLVISIATSIH